MNKGLVSAAIAALVAVAAGVAVYTLKPGKSADSVSAGPQAGADAAAPGAPSGPRTAASGAGAPVSVTTVRVQQRDHSVQLEATGTVTALNSVDVRPQVSSVIKQINIREGQFVKTGDLMFTLDARADEANVGKARAQLARDQAALADAQRQLTRSRDLLAQNFISQGAVDTNQSAVDAQKAAVAADRAAVDAAQVALGYSRIVAPSSGRVGAIPVYVGSSVQANTTTLVTITQLDPIAVSFNLPQRNLGDALAVLRGGGGKVTAQLPDGRAPITGKLQFVDNAVDASSGTVKVKAVFDNKDQGLWPGAYAPVRLSVKTLKDAMLVPQAAVIQSARGQSVYVVEAGNKAGVRKVEVLYPAGTDAVVSGVQAGDLVVVDGRQNLRPGAPLVDRSAGGARVAGASSGGAGGPGGAGAAGPAPGPGAASAAGLP